MATTYFCPDMISQQKQAAAAKQDKNPVVVFHLHAKKDNCKIGCWMRVDISRLPEKR